MLLLAQVNVGLTERSVRDSSVTLRDPSVSQNQDEVTLKV